MSEKTQLRISAIVGVVAVVAFLSWADKHDEQVAKAAQAYEACILEEYRMDPTEYRLQHGEYPVCNNPQ